VRALRQRRSWRQDDLGARAGVSQAVISLVERGQVGRIQLDTLDRIAGALDAELVVYLRWRGGDLDRLLDEGHALLVGATAAMLRSLGWDVLPEVSYQVYGERGSIDLLAWHAPTRTLLVIEVKTDLVSIEETLRKHDEKVRLAVSVARDRRGWPAGSVARLLVLPGTTAARRRVARHGSVLDLVYPRRGGELRSWLRRPDGPIGGVLFVSSIVRDRATRVALGRKRVRRPRPSTGEAGRRARKASEVL